MTNIKDFENTLPVPTETIKPGTATSIPEIKELSTHEQLDVRDRITNQLEENVAFQGRWMGDDFGLSDKSRSGYDMSIGTYLKQAGFNISEIAYTLRHIYEYGKGHENRDHDIKQIRKNSIAKTTDEVISVCRVKIDSGNRNLADYFSLAFEANLNATATSQVMEYLSSQGLGGKRDLKKDYTAFKQSLLMEAQLNDDDAILFEPHRTPYIIDGICKSEKEKKPPQLFKRSNLVCAIREVNAGTVHGIQYDEQHHIIYNVTSTQAQDYLTREYAFIVQTATSVKQIPCPPLVATTFISRQGGNDVLPLTGIIHTPIMRPDGSILHKQGYDEATGLYLTSDDFNNIDIPEYPTQEGIDDAFQTLKLPFKDFPFVADIDQAVIFCAVFTVLIRPILRAAPMFLINATKMATGKSLLVNLITMIATGKTSPGMMSYTDDENEMRKRCTALLIQGDNIACLDNVATLIHSDIPCIILTEPEFSDRILGKTELVSVPTTSTTWFATGNALGVSGDLSTRALICNLDAMSENPEEREFDINLYEWVPDNRIRLITAALTLLRAYWVCNNKPTDVKPWGRFEDWSEYVRMAVIWLGFPDPYDCTKDIQRYDPVREELSEILSAWHNALDDQELTLKELQAALHSKSEDSTREAAIIQFETVLNDYELTHPRKLGRYLSKHKGRIEDGYKAVNVGMRHKSTVWKVEKLVP